MDEKICTYDFQGDDCPVIPKYRCLMGQDCPHLELKSVVEEKEKKLKEERYE